LLRHYAFWGNFMIKPSNPDSFIPLHADWTYVDEEYDVSLNMWTPLTDTSQSNGSLCVIPNSNRVIKFIRGVNLYRFYAPNAGDIIKSYGKQLNIRLGQAIIYDHKLLHYSLANVSGIDRRAATLVFMPKNRQLFHYSSNDEGNDISEYKISSPEFFFSNNFYETPKEIPKRIFKSDFFSDLTLNDFE
jgi:ectoine hydroxylase-related dioxygenase (phytanoyl-CoA dioxygenase family)